MSEGPANQGAPRRKKADTLVLWGLAVMVLCVAGMLTVGVLSNRSQSKVTTVLLSAEGCRVAALLELKTTPAECECRIAQPDMHLYGDDLVLADGKHLSRALVVAWTK